MSFLFSDVLFDVCVFRKKLESEEKDTTTRASYKCPSCQKSFTDLDVGE